MDILEIISILLVIIIIQQHLLRRSKDHLIPGRMTGTGTRVKGKLPRGKEVGLHSNAAWESGHAEPRSGGLLDGVDSQKASGSGRGPAVSPRQDACWGEARAVWQRLVENQEYVKRGWLSHQGHGTKVCCKAHRNFKFRCFKGWYYMHARYNSAAQMVLLSVSDSPL